MTPEYIRQVLQAFFTFADIAEHKNRDSLLVRNSRCRIHCRLSFSASHILFLAPLSLLHIHTFLSVSLLSGSLKVIMSTRPCVKGKLSHDSPSVTPHSLTQPGNLEARFFWTIRATKGMFLSPLAFQHLAWEELSEDGVICNSGGHEGTASPSAVLTDGVLVS